MYDTVTSVEKHGTQSVLDQVEVGKLLLNGGMDRYEVQWDAEAKVTPMGSLVFFAQCLQTGGLMDRLCEGTPLDYSSNNAPKERDVLGTIVLSNLNGQTRYAHINALRGDRVGGEMLGVSKVVSEDSVRRALQRGTPEEWDQWLTTQERAVYEPLLSESYVLDIDDWQGTETTIKLMGWTRPRRCIFLRRSAQRPAPRKALAASTEAEFSFVERLDSGPVYEYIVLVTNDALPIVALAQLYRDRADCENVFDEIKNPWGWAGFVTRDLKRCRIMARLIALIYNWWNVFTRLARPDQLPMSRHDSQSALRCPVTSQESKRALMLLNPKSRCDPVFCEL